LSFAQSYNLLQIPPSYPVRVIRISIKKLFNGTTHSPNWISSSTICLMHLAICLGKYPITTQASFQKPISKVGISLVKISTVLTVFETLKNIDFQGGNSHFHKWKRKRGLGCNEGISQDLSLMHKAYITIGYKVCICIIYQKKYIKCVIKII